MRNKKAFFVRYVSFFFFLSPLLWSGIENQAFSQGMGISESSITPDPSAILELRSTLRGLLIPRTTTGSISSPAKGLVIYNTATDQLNFYDGTSWQVLLGGAGNGITSLNGLTGATQTFTNGTNILITSLGTAHAIGITGTIGIANGGTNSGTALSGNSIMISNGTGIVQGAINATAVNQFLTQSNSGAPAWNVISVSDLPAGNGNYIQNTGVQQPSSQFNVSGAGTLGGLLTANLGFTSSGAAIDLNANSNFATNINTGTSTGTVALGGTGVMQIDIGAGGVGSKTINIGTGAIANTITLGNSTGATALAFTSGTGNLTVTSPTNIFQTNTATDDQLRLTPAGGGATRFSGTITSADLTAARVYTFPDATGTIALVGGSGSWNIGGNAPGGASILGTTDNSAVTFQTGTGALNLGTDAAAKIITLGNSTGATSLVFNAGTGNIDIGSSAFARSINVGTGAAAQTITLGNSTGATSIALNHGTGALNLGTNAIAHTITVGNTTGATALALTSGTGNLTVTSPTNIFQTNTATDDQLRLTPAGGGATRFSGTITSADLTAARVYTFPDATGTIALVGGSGSWNIGGNAPGGASILGTTDNSAVTFQTGTGALNLGTDAAAKIITLGNSTGATSLVFNAGTGNIDIGSSAFARSINVGTGAAAQTITLGNSTGATSISLNNGTGVLNIGTNAVAHTITMGNGTGATSLVLNAGTGNIDIGVNAFARSINMGTGAAAQTITLGNSTGATSIALNNGTGALNIGTNAVAHTITMGNGTGATSLVLNAGTGNIDIGVNAFARSINVGTGAAAQTITIGNSTGITSVALNSGSGAINIGTNAVAHTITLGNSTGATTIALNNGTGALNIGTNAVAHTITLGNSTGATAIALNNGTGALNIGTNAVAHTITLGNSTGATAIALNNGTGALNIGTNAIAHTITIGNVTGATRVNVNTGTGLFNVTATNSIFSGTVTASCGVLICSDIRYKKDITNLKGSLDKVLQLQGVNYFFRKDEFPEKSFTDTKQIGFIAQEVEKIYPEFVATDSKGYKSVDYSRLTPVLVEALKELQKQVNELQQSNNVLKEGTVSKQDFEKLKADIQKLNDLVKNNTEAKMSSEK